MTVLSVLGRQAVMKQNLATIFRQPMRQFRQRRKEKPILDKSTTGPVVEADIANLKPAPWSSLVRPAVFTVGFSGASLAGCAVWQYENMRSEAMKAKRWDWGRGDARKAGEWRELVRQWWAGLSEGDKLFWPICGANILVFLAFRVPALQPAMIKWFASNPASPATCVPMVLSSFAHYGVFHLGCNMLVLHSFMPTCVHVMGREQFLGFYLAAGVASSFASMAFRVATRSTAYSLGASGAICGVVGLFSQFYPDARLAILFLPMVTFSAATAVKGLMLVDSVGLALGWRLLDHAGHLAGVLCGLGWAHYGAKEVWGRRESLVTAWHQLRSGKFDR